MTVTTKKAAATAAALDDLEAEQADLEAVLRSLEEDDWARPTPAAGWDVRDQVAHLADTEEVARGTATGGARNLNEEAARYPTAEDYTLSGVLKGRALSPAQVLEWWAGAAREKGAADTQHPPLAGATLARRCDDLGDRASDGRIPGCTAGGGHRRAHRDGGPSELVDAGPARRTCVDMC